MNDAVKDVRKALKESGYEVLRCGHGQGTVYCWIQVQVLSPESLNCYQENDDDGYRRYSREFSDYQDEVYSVVKDAAGRKDRHDDTASDYFCENISVDVIPRDRHQELLQEAEKNKARKLSHKTCPDCGKVSSAFKRHGYRFFRTCQDCGKEWSHGV